MLYIDFSIQTMKKLTFSLLFLVNLIGQISGQNISQIDSLYQLILEEPDTIKILDLNPPLNSYAGRDKDTTLFYADEIIRISKAIDWTKGIALGYNLRGLAYELSGDFDTGLENYFKAAEIAENLSWSKHTLVNILNNISIAFSYMGNMDKSIEYLLRTIQINEETQDTLRLAIAYNNLGSRYLDMSSPDLALDYFYSALQLNMNLENESRMAMNYGNIGVGFHMLKQYDSSKAYLLKAIKMNDMLEKWNTLQMNYQQIANVFYETEDYDSAWYFNELALDLDNKTNDNISRIISEKIRGSILIERNHFEEAASILEKARLAAEAIDYKFEMASVYEQLGHAYVGIGDYKKAHHYHWLALQYMDSLLVKQKDEALSKLARYQEEKTEREKDILRKDSEIQKLRANRQETISWSAAIAGFLLMILLGGLFNRYNYIQKTKKVIEKEKERSEELLLNILPAETAEELKDKGKSEARLYDQVTILFTDFKSFTEIASAMSPSQLVEEIDLCYRKFDEIISKHQIEKIKTIGDAYMAAAGLPVTNELHAIDIVNAAIEIRDYMTKLKEERLKHGKPFFEIRIGIHSGPVVAGIVGIKKFAYDIWGDTVNIASRMESNSDAGKINISETTHDLVKEYFDCQSRGEISVKGKGKLAMYYVNGRIQ